MLRAIALMMAVTCWATGSPAAQNRAQCDAPELVGHADYDALVCAGISMANERNFRGAIQTFEQAMQIAFFEYPNFELYPRLAQTYFDSGDTQTALATLEKARLSLMVLTRILRCKESASGVALHLDGESGLANVPYPSPAQQDIANVMCGAAHDTIYYPQDIDQIVRQSALISNYQDAERRIRGPR